MSSVNAWRIFPTKQAGERGVCRIRLGAGQKTTTELPHRVASVKAKLANLLYRRRKPRVLGSPPMAWHSRTGSAQDRSREDHYAKVFWRGGAHRRNELYRRRASAISHYRQRREAD